MSTVVIHRPRRRRHRIATAVILGAVLAWGGTACSGGSASGPGEASSIAPDGEKAGAALEAGLAAHAAGDLTEAAEHYDEVLKYDPPNKYAFYNLALIDEASGNYGLAEEKYRTALETDPAYGPALFNLAILRTSRAPEEAIELYQRAVAADRKDAAAWLNLGLLLRAAGQERDGDAAVRKAVNLNPELQDPAKASP